MQLKCCCVQIASKTLDPEANRIKAEPLIRKAADEGAQLIMLPEYLTTGCVYDWRLHDHAETMEGTSVAWLRGLSRDLGCWIGGGVVERNGARVHNTLLLAGPDGTCHRYRKRYPAAFEHLYFHSGRAPGIVETPFGRVGLMICWDMIQSRLLREMRGRVDLLLISSAWPRLTGGTMPLWGFQRWCDRQPRDRPRQLAKRLGVPVVYCNTAGPWETPVPGLRLMPGLNVTYRATFAGQSAIIDASGHTLAAADTAEALVTAELSVAPSASSKLTHAA